ncbi:hypothetical protein ACAG24_022520 [Mycobacterium sp. pW049]|uniref:hypothetical protein n=1 Tax=[Mycobacterium] bulgaricum TaxID=3238985 RepID=UPI00351B2C6E
MRLVHGLARSILFAFIAVAFVLLAPTGTGAGVALADPFGYEDDSPVDVDPEPAEEPGPVDEAPEPAPEVPPAEDPWGEPDPGPAGNAENGGPEQPAPNEDPGTPAEPAPPGEPVRPDDPAVPDDPGLGEDLADLDAFDPSVAEAPEPDILLADDGEADLFDPDVAGDAELDELREFVETTTETTSTQQISQWSSSWVRYDQYFRPVFSNPYRTPLSLVYTYGGSPRIVTVPPLQRAVVQTPDAGVYSFTAIANRDAGTPVISVGSFSGGGYQPAPGQPPPAKPAPATVIKNVVVRFNLGAQQYKPIKVASVVDVGDDPTVGAHQVLLDGEVPVWGAWQPDSTNGQRVFEVNKTQTLPGLEPPSQSPPPGYTLTAAESSSQPQAQADENSRSPMWIWVAVGVGAALVVGVAVGLLLRGRKAR